MANQGANLITMTPQGRRDIRLLLVDSAGGVAQFPSLGTAEVYSLPYPVEVLDAIGDGTTAPATATRFQLVVNGDAYQKYINGANTFDPKSTPDGRIGSLKGTQIAQGANIQFIGR